MSWAAHEFENYFIQKHVGLKASFLAVVAGAQLPDLFTKFFVYGAEDPAKFHRTWRGVGFTHSLTFGLVVAIVVLAATRSRAWALGILIGAWAHVLTDITDSAGTMPFFPFSVQPVGFGMWRHAAVEGRYGDAAAYYSSLGGVWDLFWFVVMVVFAWRVFKPSYFRSTIVPADPKVWGWMHSRLHMPEVAQLCLYWGFAFYGFSRLVAWFTYTRLEARTPLDIRWNGPSWVPANDISDATWQEVLLRTAVGGVLFALFVVGCWRLFIRRLWLRSYVVPALAPAVVEHSVSHG